MRPRGDRGGRAIRRASSRVSSLADENSSKCLEKQGFTTGLSPGVSHVTA
jgi:hypothetical protein